MTLLLANTLHASLLLVLLLLLSTYVCIASQQAAGKTSSSSSSSPLIQKNYIRGQYERRRRRRRTQTTNNTEQQSDGDDDDNDEDYLPEVNIKKTWLFGAGDLSELNINVTSTSSSTTSTNTNNATNATANATATTTTTSSSTSTSNTPTPIEIPSLLTGEYIIDISTGSTHSAILTNEGRILTAGSSTAGEWRGLGRDTKNGTELGFMPVVEVYSLNDDDASSSSSSSSSTATTTSTTTNNNGEMNRQHSIIAIRTSSSTFPHFVKVVASQYYTFALDTMGHVWSTGNNAYSQLCLNDTTTSTSTTSSRNRFHQIQMPHLTATSKANLFDRWNNKVIDITLGERHALLLTQDGRAFGCGWNVYGQLGLGVGMVKGGRNVGSPTEIVFDYVSSKNDTEVGGDASDASGGGRNDTNTATIVVDEERNVDHEVVTDIVAGRGSSYFLTKSGHVYSTGTNYKGQLCLGHRDDKSTPTMLAHVENFLHGSDDTTIIDDFSLYDEGVGVSAIAAAHSSFYLLLTNGMLLACGENTHGELGIGNNGNNNKEDNANNWITAEYQPTIIANVSNVTAVFSGPLSYGAYFVSDRSIYAVGFDGYTGAPREDWNVPTMLACAVESTSVERGVVISTGNDVTLYLATEETTFECTEDDDGVDGGDDNNNTTDGSAALTMKPTVSLEPTGSHVPTVSMPPTGRPSISSMPATIAPSSSPTVSTAPTSSSSPTSDATEGDTTDGTTEMPTSVADPLDGGVVTGSPQVQSSPKGKDRSSNGVEGYSPCGFEVSYLLGASLVVMWQWL